MPPGVKLPRDPNILRWSRLQRLHRRCVRRAPRAHFQDDFQEEDRSMMWKIAKVHVIFQSSCYDCYDCYAVFESCGREPVGTWNNMEHVLRCRHEGGLAVRQNHFAGLCDAAIWTLDFDIALLTSWHAQQTRLQPTLKAKKLQNRIKQESGTLLERLPKSSNSSTSYLTQQLRISSMT